MRTIVFHHHLFKNAGTSVDVALQRAFGSGWGTLEAERGELSGGDLLAHLHRHPDCVALSSHTYRLPLPRLPGVRFLPITFLRHPLERARSAYAFEREQRADTEGARLARSHDFAGYVAARLAHAGDRGLRNFQVMKLSELRIPADGTEGEELISALGTLCALPAIGLVENFAHSMQRFARLLSGAFGPIELAVAAENVTRGMERTLPARLAEAEAELGPDLTAVFLAANGGDLALHRLAARLHFGPEPG